MSKFGICNLQKKEMFIPEGSRAYREARLPMAETGIASAGNEPDLG